MHSTDSWDGRSILILHPDAFAPERGGPASGPTVRSSAVSQDERIPVYTATAFNRAISRHSSAPEGMRNNTINEVAFALGQLVGAGALNECVVVAALENAVAAWPDFKKLVGSIKSGLRAGMAQPRYLSDIGRPAPPNGPSARGSRSGGEASSKGGGDAGDPPDGSERLSRETIQANAGEAQNDTGNGRRMRRWFGHDILHIRHVGPAVWVGTHWECEGADEALVRMAQAVSDRIALEAAALGPTETEAEILGAADAIDPVVMNIDARSRDATPEQRAAKKEATIAHRAAESVATKIEERRKSRLRFSISSGNANRVAGMIAMQTANMTIGPDDLDPDPLKINVRNGTLRLVKEKKEIVDPDCPDPDIERRITVTQWRVQLDPHDRADRISKLMPVEFDPKATAPKFKAFLDRFQPKAGIRNYLQTFHGYALTALTGEQAFLFNYGLGANGKTTFLEAISALQGNYAAVLPAEALTGNLQRRGDQATPEFARLTGARLVRCAELPRGQGFREHTLKLLTGGDAILVRHLHKGFFEMQPTFKAVGSGNDQPSIGGVDEGIWRRMKLIPWEETIPREERRPMARVLRDFEREGPGILNWLLDGLVVYLENGLKAPREIAEATESYRANMDPIGEFARAHIVDRPGEDVTARTMFEAYVAWCDANSVKHFTERTFAKIMAQKGFKKKIAAVRLYIDVMLVNVPVRTPEYPDYYQ